jgi:LPXTG-site transpeptidase (sortase) family protein
MKRIGINKILLTLIYLIIFFEGVFFLGRAYYEGYYLKRILNFSNIKGYDSQEIRQSPLPVQITIPNLNINLEIKETNINNGYWEVTDDYANHLSISARPEENGNIVIYAHNKAKLFGKLRYLKRGNKIIIRTTDNSKYEYLVKDIKEVLPTDTFDVQSKNYKTLTLFTCIGFMDNKRLVIQADPIY